MVDLKRSPLSDPVEIEEAGSLRRGNSVPTAAYRQNPALFRSHQQSVLGDINHVHPFREGNDRTQLQYLKLLAAHTGHIIDLTRIDRVAWLEASRRSNTGDHAAMTRCIRFALISPVAFPVADADGSRLPRHRPLPSFM